MTANFVSPGTAALAFGPKEPGPSSQLSANELLLVLSKLLEDLMNLVAELMRLLESSLAAGKDDAAALDASVMTDGQFGG